MSIPQPPAPRRFQRVALWLGITIFLLIIGVGLYRSLDPQRDSGIAPDFTLDIYDADPIQLSRPKLTCVR